MLCLKERESFQNETTIFIKSQIQSDLVLDCIILKKIQGNHSLSLIIKPIPDINIDSLIFGSSNNEPDLEKISDDYKGDIRLKISDTRQKIDCNIEYKSSIFLGELIPVDFTFKCRKGCEIVDPTFEVVDNSHEVESPRKVKSRISSFRKSTSLPVSNDVDIDDPFELANKTVKLKNSEFEIFYVKPTDEDFITLPIESNDMEEFPSSNIINLYNFDESQTINLRL